MELTIEGTCDPRFNKVRDTFATNFQRRGDVGASFALSLEGEMVVDLWAGCRDRAGTLAWEADTIVNVYSTTKTMAALCLLVLADRDQVDLAAPVVTYWPEFGQHGKDRVLVKHFLSHSAGLPGFAEPIEPELLFDWDAVVERLAAEVPWWEPGERSGYHAVTQGFLLGEIVRRATGQTLGQYFAEHIAGPLQADFHIGLDPRHFHRVAELIPGRTGASIASGQPEDSLGHRAADSVPLPSASSEAWRRAELPAVNGHGNARSVVRAQTPIANAGSAFGVELLSPAGAARALEQQTQGVDLVLGFPVRFGLGYGLNDERWPLKPTAAQDTCFWGGWGGSLVVMDTAERVCFGYVMNKMTSTTLGDRRAAALAYATYECLGVG